MARTKAVVLRLSEEEYSLLKELSGREPMNAYLRRVAGLMPSTTADISPVLKEPARHFEGARGAEPQEPPAIMKAVAAKWFCPKCERLSTVPRCPVDPAHKVTPA